MLTPLMRGITSAFIIICGAAVLAGVCLSTTGRLNSLFWWLVVAAPAAAGGLWFLGGGHPEEGALAAHLGNSNAWLFRFTMIVAGIALLANLLLAFGTAPGAWDALTYHLPKAALALQHHAFYTGPVNYWAQAAHPQYGTALLVFAAVVSGSREWAWCAWQMISYLVAAVCVVRIAQHTGASTREAAFAAALFLLLPSAIVQAPTPLNDMLLAAITGAAAVELLEVMRSGATRAWIRLTIALALGFGTKANFTCQALMLLALGGALTWPLDRQTMRRAAAISAATIVGLLLALPSGYLSNVRRFGNALAGC